MKATITLLITAALCCIMTGCAHITVEKTASINSTNVTFHGTSFLANSAFKNLGVDGTTKTTANLLKISGATTEPNPEAITASADGLGSLIGVAAGSAAKTMVGAPSAK